MEEVMLKKRKISTKAGKPLFLKKKFLSKNTIFNNFLLR
jgi:hypothetical protein